MSGFLQGLSDNIRIDKSKCVFCGDCVERCILDNLRMKLAPCRQACPLGVNAQGYVQLIARGQEARALEVLRETLPFPGILGRVCSHPCEKYCYLRKLDSNAVSIRALKRYLIGHAEAREMFPPDIAPDTGKNVAVIGSGPAGIMAAYDLRMKGHGVTVFEAESAPGGMMRWAIPEFRLPLDILEKEIEMLGELGVVFQCGLRLGKDKQLDDFREEFQAIIIATGCPDPAKLHIQGEELQGVTHGLPFLREVRSGRMPQIGRNVIVIGGGNVAVDSAQTALRLGAEQITLACLESQDIMPAIPSAVESALFEGVKLECCWGPIRFTANNGVLKGVEFQRCTRVFDETGRFRPSLNPRETMRLEAETVIVATGQYAERTLMEDAGLIPDESENIDLLTLQTTDEQVFMAGDVVNGPSSVVEAMAEGRRAAHSVDRFLKGEPLRWEREYMGPVETDFEIDTSNTPCISRAQIPIRTFQGKGDFEELEQCLDEDIARQEAKRCCSCGEPFGKYKTCWFCLPCEVECPESALWVEIPYLLR